MILKMNISDPHGAFNICNDKQLLFSMSELNEFKNEDQRVSFQKIFSKIIKQAISNKHEIEGDLRTNIQTLKSIFKVPSSEDTTIDSSTLIKNCTNSIPKEFSSKLNKFCNQYDNSRDIVIDSLLYTFVNSKLLKFEGVTEDVPRDDVIVVSDENVKSLKCGTPPYLLKEESMYNNLVVNGVEAKRPEIYYEKLMVETKQKDRNLFKHNPAFDGVLYYNIKYKDCYLNLFELYEKAVYKTPLVSAYYSMIKLVHEHFIWSNIKSLAEYRLATVTRLISDEIDEFTMDDIIKRFEFSYKDCLGGNFYKLVIYNYKFIQDNNDAEMNAITSAFNNIGDKVTDISKNAFNEVLPAMKDIMGNLGNNDLFTNILKNFQ